MVVVSCKSCAALRAVILGAPASGKGTVSFRIVENFPVNHISTGDKLRHHVANKTELGREVKRYLKEGRLVPDDTMIALTVKEIECLADKDWLLDGFPRTVEQAEKLQSMEPINMALNLVVPHSVIIERAKGRLVHLPSGRVYNAGFKDPKVPGKDDVTGEPLSQRPDDKPEVVEKRLHDYETVTRPVVEFYRKLGVLHEFHGDSTNEMWPRIKKRVSEYMSSN